MADRMDWIERIFWVFPEERRKPISDFSLSPLGERAGVRGIIDFIPPPDSISLSRQVVTRGDPGWRVRKGRGEM